MEVKVVGLNALLDRFRNEDPKQLRFATMLAINRTASKVRDRQYSEMHRVFDRPTPYTLKSLRVIPATKNNLSAEVGFKDAWAARSAKYLTPQVEGGGRGLKGIEKALHRAFRIPQGSFLVPGPGARLDQYGNVSSGQIVTILSALKGHIDQYAWRTKESRQRRKTKDFYFATRTAIWQRVGKKFNLIFMIKASSPRYPKRYPFYELSNKFANEIFDEEFDRALKEALATAR